MAMLCRLSFWLRILTVYRVPRCRPLSWCSTEFPDSITVTVTLGTVPRRRRITRVAINALSSVFHFASLTLGGLIAEDEPVYFPQTGCPLQHSSGIRHVDHLQMCWRSGHCSQDTIHGVSLADFTHLDKTSSCR